MNADQVDPVMSAISGAQEADALIAEVHVGCASPDAVHEAIQAVVAAGDVDRMRAFARRLQKRLENPR